MRTYGLTTVADIVGDFIIFRALVPADSRLPGLAEMRTRLHLPAGSIPRKNEPDYARVTAQVLRAARALTAPHTPLTRLVYLGDTRMSDGAAFTNLCRAGQWLGCAFIGAETAAPPHFEVVEQSEGALCLANRWTALGDFAQFCCERGGPPNEQTALVLDLDKTLVAARGRNDTLIDAARVAAVKATVGGLLGSAFDAARFQVAYETLNRPEFHPFTADNQDYLAYICLMLSGGVVDLDALLGEVRGKRLRDFVQFIRRMEERATDLPPALRELHGEIYARVQANDPTPFKLFRRNEYRETVARFGCGAEDAAPEMLLQQEIVITQEVRALALEWQAQGALVFALSDKPDEAVFPPAEMAAEGYRPLHHTPTHAVGME